MQVLCHLFRAQLQLQQQVGAEAGGSAARGAAKGSLAAAAAAAEQLLEGSGAAAAQLRLHMLLLETLRQLAAGETGSGMLTGAPATPMALLLKARTP